MSCETALCLVCDGIHKTCDPPLLWGNRGHGCCVRTQVCVGCATSHSSTNGPPRQRGTVPRSPQWVGAVPPRRPCPCCSVGETPALCGRAVHRAGGKAVTGVSLGGGMWPCRAYFPVARAGDSRQGRWATHAPRGGERAHCALRVPPGTSAMRKSLTQKPSPLGHC